ncbi:MAG: Sua5/YciO/YrdC/YwlC family protein, partial [Planctomycetales bacterium]|nr:Sua5/YciO/YrdC/YwlC family protein [Planctomycetales bacterium]
MPRNVIEVARADDVRDVVHRAVQALVEGGLVVMPTETVYGVAASACSPEGVRRLTELKQRSDQSPFA